MTSYKKIKHDGQECAVEYAYKAGSVKVPSSGSPGDATHPIYIDSNGVPQICTGISASYADALTPGRTVRTDLESESAPNFDGTADIAPGVSGVLPVAHGGTGSSSVDSTPTANSTKMVTSGGVQAQIDTVQSDIDSVRNGLGTAAAKNAVTSITGSANLPTDKTVRDFVNSSVATNTANYISNNGSPFTSLSQLQSYTGTVTNNDYAFVTGTDSAGNTYYDRYKATVSGSTVTWAKEYRLNNSSFTQAQWQAISSGLSSTDKTTLDNLVSGTTAAGKATQLANSRNIGVQDADGTNTGTAASFNGTGNATIKLPSTIKASITGNCSGSSGSCTGNQASATNLQTARAFQVDLASTSAPTFNGTAQCTPGVKNVLKVANGGTGNSSVDTTPTSGSTKMCTSGGIYTRIENIRFRWLFDWGGSIATGGKTYLNYSSAQSVKDQCMISFAFGHNDDQDYWQWYTVPFHIGKTFFTGIDTARFQDATVPYLFSWRVSWGTETGSQEVNVWQKHCLITSSGSTNWSDDTYETLRRIRIWGNA